MARSPIKKELENSRLLKEYASWIYCDGCGKTIAYLCYVTYDCFLFEYVCRCGNKGRVLIKFEHEPLRQDATALVTVRNRLCCPNDKLPLVTFVNKNLAGYSYAIGCHECHTTYSGVFSDA